ncbi:unnamed protein product [Diamesa serratosioi]
MYPSCVNITEDLRSLSLCEQVQNITDEPQIFDEELERIVSVSVFILFGLIGIAGLLGNGLVVIVVAFNPMMRSTTNILIINLALSDLLFVIFCVPFTATDYILTNWPFGNFWCKFVQYMIVATCHGSVYTLVLMSLDRFLAVVHPISSISIRTEKNAIIAIIFAWFLIFTSAIPVAITHGEVSYVHKGQPNTACLFLSEEGYSHVAFQISFFLSSYVIPLAIIILLYVVLLSRLWKGGPGGSKGSKESRRGKKRVTRMVVFVVLAFAICWLPIQIVLVLKSLRLYETTTFTVSIQIISHVLAYTNSCVNPFLYAFLSENFRKAFRKIMWCGPQTTQYMLAGPQTKSTRTGTGNGTSNADIL